MTVYAEVGASLQQIGGSCPDGWIAMQGERPSLDHVADASGQWAVDQAKIIESMRSAIQAHMDKAAQDYGYDDVKAAVTYAEEPAVPKFQAEGRAFRAWRSLVWAHAYEVLDAVQAGDREQPTTDELLAELPELVFE